MKKRCKNIIEHVGAKTRNSKKPLFDGTEPERVYYSFFEDTEDSEDNVLPYEE